MRRGADDGQHLTCPDVQLEPIDHGLSVVGETNLFEVHLTTGAAQYLRLSRVEHLRAGVEQ